MNNLYVLTLQQLLIGVALCLTAGLGLGGFIFFFVGYVRGLHDGVNDPGAQFEAGYANGYDDCAGFHSKELQKVLDEVPEYKHTSVGFRVGDDGVYRWFEE